MRQKVACNNCLTSAKYLMIKPFAPSHVADGHVQKNKSYYHTSSHMNIRIVIGSVIMEVAMSCSANN